ncbi:phosphoglycerate mutase [Prolixibacteraceae bacterium JC049]|nr:phosphoglycerate mutase [Prolixibacteraceae bacterium JC049]
MKRLILVRHAKAEEHGLKPDYDRRLRPRGRKDSKLVAGILQKSHGIKPDHIISSPAPRAKETAEIFSDVLHFPHVSIIKELDLYNGMSSNEFIQLIRATDESAKTVMVFGHNPHIYMYAHNLLPAFYLDVPTGTAISILFDIEDWNDLNPKEGRLEFHEYPKLYKAPKF